MTADATPPRVLIAYDGTDEARHAVAVAGRLLGSGDALVLHVHEPPYALVGVGGPGIPVMPHPPEDIQREAEERAEAVAREGCELARAAGFRTTRLADEATGTAGVASAILRAADEHGADVIVLASRDRPRLLEILAGSVSDSVVHRAHVPVLIVPGDCDSR